MSEAARIAAAAARDAAAIAQAAAAKKAATDAQAAEARHAAALKPYAAKPLTHSLSRRSRRYRWFWARAGTPMAQQPLV